MKKLLAVDGNSIINRAFYGVRPLSTKEGLPTNALFGMVNILEKNLAAVEPDFAAIAFDLKAPTFRHKIYAEYKAGRRPMPEELATQFPLAKETAAALGFTCMEKEGYEADDILGTLSRLAEEEGAEAYLLTGDRDALQLISDRVHILLATNTETIDFTPARFREKYGVDPSVFVDVKALMGDSSDNIPGVPGIGEKTALKLISEHGSLDGVYHDLPTANLTPSVRAKLENGKESAYFSRTLATICREVPLEKDLAACAYHGADRPALTRLFTKFEFSAMIKRMGLDQAEEVPAKEAEAAGELMLGEGDISALPAEIAIGCEDGKFVLFDGKNLLTPENEAVLCAVLEKPGIHTVCHDAKSLYKALAAKGIRYRHASFDTMLAAYVLNPGDAGFDLPRLTLATLGTALPPFPQSLTLLLPLYREQSEKIKSLGMEKLLKEIEMPLSAVLADMELAGFCVNREGLVAYGAQLTEVAEQLSERIRYYAGGDFNINSTKQLGEVLFERLGLPHGKKTKTGYSTNAEVLEKLRSVHPIVDDILDYRQLTKLNSTYAEGLVKEIESDGRIRTVFKQTGTATGRLSSAEPNLQNIPIRTELGRELRRYFVAKSKDYVLIDADYSQIELRLLAALAGDENMINAFRNGEDIHTSTAATVFGVPKEMVTPEMRKSAKAVNFGIVYGIGAHSLSEDLHVSMKEAKAYIDSYFAAYPGISAYLENTVKEAKENGFVTTLFGRRRYIPELKMSNKNMQHFGERVAMNSPIQGTAADIIKIAMIRVDEKLKASGLDAKLILQVHDELIVECKREEADAARKILVDEMESAVSLAVPLSVSAGTGENWYECH